MIIDCHAHVFPDELAPKAMKKLTESIDNLYTPVHDGTVSGLIESMDRCSVGISVICPVITKKAHVRKTNEWVRSVCSERIIGFGGIYPHEGDCKPDIDHAVSLGLKGLKFHAEYQEFVLDDDKMLKIYDYALNKGLILLHHAGFDPAYPPPYRSTPQKFASIAARLKGGTVIAAHLGGHAQWDDVERYLPGSGIYLDTSMGFEYFSEAQFLSIAKSHGTDKILFGSDSPWSDAKTEIEHLKALPLAGGDISAMLGENAKRIFKIQ
ncbi:MAG: amidohydrolase family protein [Oscillospiraceae bacterium]|nr:amidohydrolase family protein [Oscillospiraceae bacterium]